MTRADNSAYLAQANAQRHQAALLAARHAIQELQRQGQAVNFSTVAQSAGVSRGWSSPPRPAPRPHQPPAGSQATSRPPGCRAPRNRRLAPASGSMPPAPRSPACEPRTAPSATSSPAISASSGPSTTSTPQPSRDDHGHDPCHGCGEDMSTPQKCLPTRHYLQTTSDNRLMGGGLDVSMLLLRYAGMADLYTGAVQRRVTTIPGSAAGHSASRSTAAPGTALSWTCRHRACPRTMQPAARRPVPAAECSRRSRPDRCARRARHQPLVYMRWPVSSPRARASECAASPVRAVPVVSCP